MEILGILLVIIGVVLCGWKKHKRITTVIGIILVICGFGVQIHQHNVNDWSTDSPNWSNISRYKEHVTDANANIKNVYMYKKHLVMRVDNVNLKGKEVSNSMLTVHEALHYAKKSSLSKRGLFLYQKQGLDGWFIAYYSPKNLKHIPSTYDLDQDPDLMFTQSNMYRLSNKFVNGSKLSESLPMRSNKQNQLMANFSMGRVMP